MAFALFIGWGAWGAVRVEPLFGPNMVLQRDRPAPVWGTAEPGETVTVRFAGQEIEAKAGEDGKWRVALAAMPASGEPREMEIANPGNTIRIPNVLVGDVWLCAGQSNMAFQLNKSRGGKEAAAAADFPQIRFSGAHFVSARKPTEHIAGAWTVCSPEKAGGFSAVPFYFAREFHKSLGVPIGLLSGSVSGSVAEIWMSREALMTDPYLEAYAEAWDWIDGQYRLAGKSGKDAQYLDPEGKTVTRREIGERFIKWRDAARQAAKAGRPIPGGFPAVFASWNEVPTPDSIQRSSAGFNSLIAPRIPYAISGVIWYQGESNTKMRDPAQYEAAMTALIRDWRERWGRPDLPFLIVQLPNYGKPSAEPVKGSWPVLREQQANLGRNLPNVFVATTIDTATVDKGNLHPTNKEPVGRRLALLAMKHVNDQPVEAHGPEFAGMKVEGRKVRLMFSNAAGLAAAPLDPGAVPAGAPESQLGGFAIAGGNGEWKWAQARIDGEEVLVWSDDVSDPVAVRHAWTDYPAANLVNGAGLPAAPFRLRVSGVGGE